MLIQNFGSLEKYQKIAVFDRDNTLIHDSGYTYRVEDLKWIGGSITALKWLTEKGIGLVVATNQSGISRGFFTENHVFNFHRNMNEELASHGVQIDVFVICPHLPASNLEFCKCRKPNPGMIEFIKEQSTSAKQIVLFGDRDSDYMAAKNARIEGFLLDSKKSLDALVKEVFEQ